MKKREFNLIKFQDNLISKFNKGHKSYTFRTSRAAVRELVTVGYNLNEAIQLVNDAFDTSLLESPDDITKEN